MSESRQTPLMKSLHSFNLKFSTSENPCSDVYNLNRYKVKPVALKVTAAPQGGHGVLLLLLIGSHGMIDFEEQSCGLGIDSILTIKSAESETVIWFPDLSAGFSDVCLIIQILGNCQWPVAKGTRMHCGMASSAAMVFYENNYFTH